MTFFCGLPSCSFCPPFPSFPFTPCNFIFTFLLLGSPPSLPFCMYCKPPSQSPMFVPSFSYFHIYPNFFTLPPFMSCPFYLRLSPFLHPESTLFPVLPLKTSFIRIVSHSLPNRHLLLPSSLLSSPLFSQVKFSLLPSIHLLHTSSIPSISHFSLIQNVFPQTPLLLPPLTS